MKRSTFSVPVLNRDQLERHFSTYLQSAVEDLSFDEFFTLEERPCVLDYTQNIGFVASFDFNSPEQLLKKTLMLSSGDDEQVIVSFSLDPSDESKIEHRMSVEQFIALADAFESAKKAMAQAQDALAEAKE